MSITRVISKNEHPFASMAKTIDVPGIIHQRLHTSSAEILADTVSTLTGGSSPLVAFYDALVARTEQEISATDKNSRAARRLLDEHQIREVVDLLRKKYTGARHGKALFFATTPRAMHTMAAHVLEMADLEVVFLGAQGITEMVELISLSDRISYIVIDASLLSSGAVRSATLKALSHAFEVVSRDQVLLLHTSNSPIPGQYVDYGLRSLRNLADMEALVTPSSSNPLTAREIDVLREVASGRSNDSIARQLQISLGTVKTYLERVHQKLSSVDRASAVAVALRHGWLE